MNNLHTRESAALRLPPQNATVVGAFNPAIFQPEWVRAHVPGIEGPLELFLAAPPLQQPLLKAANGSLHILVSPERMIVYGDAAKIGEAAAAILGELPHTPVQAAGVNFVFEGVLDPLVAGPWSFSSDGQRAEQLLGGEHRSLTFSEVVQRSDGVQITAKLAWPSARHDVLLDLNYHRDASKGTSLDRTKELAAHLSRALEFETDARRVREEIFRGKD